MGLKLVTPPDGYPVTLVEAKAQLNVDYSHDDALIQGMIAAATDSLDGYYGWLGRALLPQMWDYFIDAFPVRNDGLIQLPLPPLISVDSVSYADPNAGPEIELDAETYSVDDSGIPTRIIPSAVWPMARPVPNAVRVRFTAGYTSGESPGTSPGTSPNEADRSAIPAAIRHAILIMVRDLYDSRGSFVIGVSIAPTDAVERLLGPYRVIIV